MLSIAAGNNFNSRLRIFESFEKNDVSLLIIGYLK